MLSNLVKSHAQHIPSVLEEIGTTPEQLNKDVAALREWYSYQTHLPQSIGDSVLSTFIVGSKNSMEIAKMKIDMYYSQRKALPEIYDNCDPTSNELVKSYKTVYTITLPSLTSDGSSVSILKLRNLDPAMYNALEPIKRINMIYDLMVQKTTLTSKTHLIYDYEGVTNAHITQVNPLVIKAHLDTLKFLPIRLKSVIAINCPKFAEKTYNLMRSLVMSKKLQERVFVYAEGASVLSKHISVDVLPKDYGGQGTYTLEDLNDYWQVVLTDNREWFMNENERYSDESKRPADSKYKASVDTYGVEGSFKKLQID